MRMWSFIRRISLIVLGCGGIAIASWLAVHHAKKIIQVSSHIEQPAATAQDFFMDGVSYLRFNHDGKRLWEIYATKLHHIPQQDQYFFERPIVIVATPDNGVPDWEIRAQHARSEYGKQKIILWGKVELLKREGKNFLPMKILTDEVIFYPEQQLADLKNWVTIHEFGNLTKALGAKADFKTGVVHLLSQIESIYQVY